MKRKMVNIDQEKCDGCGLCVKACHEGALQLVNGKAVLVSESYCDGLGDCLPACPRDAIRIEEREAAPYDEAAVKAAMARKATAAPPMGGCPGMQARLIDRAGAATPTTATEAGGMESQLRQWPCQIKLVPLQAPYFAGARLLIAADCAAYAYAGLHQDFMRGRITLIGCPKLDDVDYSEKLTEILRRNDIQSVIVVRMSVPCCGGLTEAVRVALQSCGKTIPWRVVVIGTDGRLQEES